MARIQQLLMVTPLMLLLTSGIAAAVESGGRCESHWTKFGQQCYQFFDSSKDADTTNWAQAKARCESLGAELANPDDAATMKLAMGISSSTKQKLWLTNCRLANSDSSDTAAVSADCQQTGSVLCVKPVSNCAVGWYSFNNRCFLLTANRLSWDEAHATCVAMGADLLQVKNEATQTFINKYLSSFVKQGVNSIWIGLYQIRVKPGQPLEWTSGGQADNYYQNWNVDEPKISSAERNSVWINANDDRGRWEVNRPTLPRGYVCEIPEGRIPIEPTPDNKFSCPDGWSLFRGNCYSFHAYRATWFGSRDRCKNINADLIDIRDDAEQEFVQRHTGSTQLWVGLHSKQDKWGTWYWNDDPMPATYFNWAEGEPNNHEGKEFCVVVWDGNGKWNDEWCYMYTYYGCKRPADLGGSPQTTQVAPTTPNGPICGAGWFRDPFTDFCYQFNLEPMTWQDARLYCKSVGGDLTSITSLNEKSFITGRIQSMSQSGVSVLGYWIGFNDLAEDTRWVWSDDSPVAFVNWDRGEPNKLEGESCTQLYPNTFFWNDEKCSNKYAVVCKKFGKVEPTQKPPATTIAVPPGKVRGCPSGYSGFKNMCYRLYTDRQDWHRARQRCKEDGGDLVSYEDRREFDFVFDMIQKQGNYRIWTGLHDTAHALRTMFFQWSDGSPVTFTNWNKGEPNDFTDDVNCVEQYGSGLRGQWNDMRCDLPLSSVCKRREIVLDNPPEPTIPPQGCPPDYDDMYNGVCYKYVIGRESVTWTTARTRCIETPSASLVAVTSAEVQGHLNLRLFRLQASGGFWIGLYQAFYGLRWTECCYLGSNGYTNWQTGASTALRYTYMNAEGVQLGTWNMTDRSGEMRNYVCSVRRLGPTTPKPPPTTYDPRFCAEGWVEADGTCYRPFYMRLGSMRLVWEDARHQCKLLGGDLASIHSPNATEAIRRVIRSTDTGYWIGLNSRANSKVLVWSDGSTGNYFNWKPNEPNNHNERLNCATLDARDTQWSVSACAVRRNWICETPKGINPASASTAEPTTAADLPGCPALWRRFGNSCYRTTVITYDWYGSRDYCRRDGGDLASITSQEENDFLLQLASRYSGRGYWTGLNELGQTEGFKWTDGSPVSYVNWDRGEPNNAGGAQHCVSMYSGSGLWKDDQCGNRMRALCKLNNSTEGRTEAPKTPMPGECPAGYYTAGDKCYRVFAASADAANWTEAFSACGRIVSGGRHYLASVHNEFEQATLIWMVRDAQVDLWIGLHSVQSRPRSFVWIDNSKVRYTNWDRAQPSRNSEGDDLCVQLHTQQYRAGRWSNIPCRLRRGYVCMMYKVPDIRTTWPGPAPTRRLCEAGWLQFGSACFKSFARPAAWPDAQQNCADNGAHLASVHDAWEQNYLRSVAGVGDSDSVWIGLNDRDSRGLFVWSDGWPTVYTFWGSNQPSSREMRCVRIGRRGRWFNSDCVNELPYVCRKSFGQPPTTPLTPQGRCPNDKDFVQFGSWCYYFSRIGFLPQRLKFADAQLRCKFWNGDLASVGSQSEQDFLARVVDQRSQSGSGSRIVNLWLGMTRQFQAGFRWTDGSPVNYVHWAEGAPADSDGSDNRNCVEMFHVDYKWSDASCQTENGFVCKVPLLPPTAASRFTTRRATTTATPTTGRLSTPSVTTGRITQSPGGSSTEGQRTSTEGPGLLGRIRSNANHLAVAMVFTLIVFVLLLMVVLVIVYKRARQQRPQEAGFSNANWNRSSGSVQLENEADAADAAAAAGGDGGFENPSFGKASA